MIGMSDRLFVPIDGEQEAMNVDMKSGSGLFIRDSLPIFQDEVQGVRGRT